MRIEERITVAVDCDTVFDYVTDPANYTEFMEGVTRWDVEGEIPTAASAPANPHADEVRLRTGGRADRNRGSGSPAATWRGKLGHGPRPARPRGSCATPGRGEPGSLRFAYGVAGARDRWADLRSGTAARSLRPRSAMPAQSQATSRGSGASTLGERNRQSSRPDVERSVPARGRRSEDVKTARGQEDRDDHRSEKPRSRGGAPTGPSWSPISSRSRPSARMNGSRTRRRNCVQAVRERRTSIRGAPGIRTTAAGGPPSPLRS